MHRFDSLDPLHDAICKAVVDIDVAPLPLPVAIWVIRIHIYFSTQSRKCMRSCCLARLSRDRTVPARTPSI